MLASSIILSTTIGYFGEKKQLITQCLNKISTTHDKACAKALVIYPPTDLSD